jgi:hypothetical protein
VANQVDAAELRVVVLAAVLAVAADAVRVAQQLLYLGAHLVTALDGRASRAVTRENLRSRRAQGLRAPYVVRTCRLRPRGKTR